MKKLFKIIAIAGAIIIAFKALDMFMAKYYWRWHKKYVDIGDDII